MLHHSLSAQRLLRPTAHAHLGASRRVNKRLQPAAEAYALLGGRHDTLLLLVLRVVGCSCLWRTATREATREATRAHVTADNLRLARAKRNFPSNGTWSAACPPPSRELAAAAVLSVGARRHSVLLATAHVQFFLSRSTRPLKAPGSERRWAALGFELIARFADRSG